MTLPPGGGLRAVVRVRRTGRQRSRGEESVRRGEAEGRGRQHSRLVSLVVVVIPSSVACVSVCMCIQKRTRLLSHQSTTIPLPARARPHHSIFIIRNERNFAVLKTVQCVAAQVEFESNS